MKNGRDGMTLGSKNGERRGAAQDEPPPCTALRLLATLVEGARAPVIAGNVAMVTTWVPFEFFDDLLGCVTGLDAAPHAASHPDASGAWSGVLLPMQREAGRLLPEIFIGIGNIVVAPAGGYDLTVTVDLAAHDRLALWGASLDLVAHLLEWPAPRPVLPLTALEPGVPQEMAAIVRDLYATQARPAPEAPGHLSAA